MGSRVELYEAIRRDARRQGLGIRALASRYGVHRRTVRQALACPWPPERKRGPCPAPRLDPAKALIDAMLREDLDAPRKQRHTARRVWDRLIDEHHIEVSYSTVRAYVARRRPEILAEVGRAVEEGFVPQDHPPGAEAEVDFADLWIDLRGVRTKVFLFTLRLSCSGRAVHKAFASQSQESFLDGHEYAFTMLGGVPFDKIRYDNLKAAVSRVMFGRNRVESQRWVVFRSHMGFESFYCRPGQEGAHEKGGVEGEGGRFRRTHLVPVPKVGSLAELNARLAAADITDDSRHIAHRFRSVGAEFAREQPLLQPLPAERFETGLSLEPLVDRYSRLTVRQCTYSVPARFIGRRLRTLLRADEVVVFDRRQVVARHERSTVKGSTTLVLDHYLEILARKPGALPGATALAQARASGAFTAAHDAFWAAARRAHGDAHGTRELVEVLLLHRHLAHADVVAGLHAAAAAGAVRADIVAVEARRIADTHPADRPSPPGTDHLTSLTPPGVTSLTERRLGDPAAVIAGLPADSRPVPTVASYDQLLTHRHPAPSQVADRGEVS
ncbi:MAG TPA: IS21 family transposase [Pseudonocardiaceae bacterium]|nr:IS21 family transposase [Pseudonocardiaceae bacterium]